jgi:hypothetical protein
MMDAGLTLYILGKLNLQVKYLYENSILGK